MGFILLRLVTFPLSNAENSLLRTGDGLERLEIGLRNVCPAPNSEVDGSTYCFKRIRSHPGHSFVIYLPFVLYTTEREAGCGLVLKVDMHILIHH